MRWQHPAVRWTLVWISVVSNLALLFSTRYTRWLFPLGLSFYAFQSLSYTLDVYRRDRESTRSLLAYLSAVTFFPTLQAGPSPESAKSSNNSQRSARSTGSREDVPSS
jgi:D-alanyl-lipoteichoic acid acyltransferase DltB (MBOAT superfamily)